MQDTVVTAARAHEGVVPSDCTDATIVATECPYKLVLVRVPDLELTRVRTNREKVAIS